MYQPFNVIFALRPLFSSINAHACALITHSEVVCLLPKRKRKNFKKGRKNISITLTHSDLYFGIIYFHYRGLVFSLIWLCIFTVVTHSYHKGGSCLSRLWKYFLTDVALLCYRRGATYFQNIFCYHTILKNYGQKVGFFCQNTKICCVIFDFPFLYPRFFSTFAVDFAARTHAGGKIYTQKQQHEHRF